MINDKNIDFLYKFYKEVNQANDNKIDLTKFFSEDNTDYSFKEDIIDDLKLNLNDFELIIKNIDSISLKKSINELIFEKDFIKSLNDLYRVMGNLSINFDDFQKLAITISQSLPEGPKDDSELI